jgi:hypothetical protein
MGELSTWMRLVLAVLATWRITHLLAREDGPADIIARLRSVVGDGMLGKLMDCFYCLSIWVAAPFAFMVCKDPVDIFLSWLALSGAACLLERFSQEPVVIQPLSPTQMDKSINTKNTNHGMLRTEADGLPEQPFNGEVRTNSH